MKIDVYETMKKNAFVLTEHEKEISTLPGSIRQLIGDHKLWKTIDTTQRHLSALDPIEIIESKIKEQGYYLQGATILVKEST